MKLPFSKKNRANEEELLETAELSDDDLVREWYDVDA